MIEKKAFTPLLLRFFITAWLTMLLASCNFSLIGDVTPPASLQQLSTEQPSIPSIETTESGLAIFTPSASNSSSSGSTAAVSPISLKITGQVINHTEEDLPKDLLVTLHGFNQSVEVYTKQTFIDENGHFFFEDVQIDPAWVVYSSTNINQITYHSDVVTPIQASTSLDLSIPIYGTTNDLSVLSIDRLHIFLELLSPETLRVVQLFIISNNSPMLLTAATPGGAVIPFDLPKQASNLKFLDGILGQRYRATENGFADTTAVLPGEGSYQIMFAFDLPFDQKVDIVQTMTIPVQSFTVLASKNDLYHTMRVKGDLLKTAEVREIGGTQYDTYRGESVSAGGKLQVTVLASQPTLLNPRWPFFMSNSLNDIRLIIGASFLGITLIMFGVWMLFKERRTKRKNDARSESEEVSYDNPEGLMDAIIALDDIYKSGDLPDKAYQERRTKLKTRLSELLKE